MVCLSWVLNINFRCIESRNIKLTCKLVYFISQIYYFLRFMKTFSKVDKFLSFFFLNTKANLEKFIKESTDFSHVLLQITSSCYSRCSNSDTTRSDSWFITNDSIFVERDVNLITCIFHFWSGETLVNTAHEDNVIIRTISNKLVPPFHQFISKYLSI